MSNIALYPTRGFIVELDRTPAGLTRELEASGAALIASRTVEGLYVEPAQSLAAVLAELDHADVVVLTVRSTGITQTWERTVRPWHHAPRSPLRNPPSACWLTTLPAA